MPSRTAELLSSKQAARRLRLPRFAGPCRFLRRFGFAPPMSTLLEERDVMRRVRAAHGDGIDVGDDGDEAGFLDELFE